MKEAREGPVIKGLGYQGNTGVGQMLARFMESTDVVPTCAGPVGWEKEFNEGTMACLLVFPSPERVTLFPNPAALSLKLLNLDPLHVSEALSELLPLCWSLEQVNFCKGPLEVAIQSHRAICLSTSSLLAFKDRCYGDSSFQHRCPGLGRLVWG